VPHLTTCIFLFFYNEQELGVGTDLSMALTPLTSSIGRGSNPQPSDRDVLTHLHKKNLCIELDEIVFF